MRNAIKSIMTLLKMKWRYILPSTSNCSSLSSRTECRGGGSRWPKCNHLASGLPSSSLPQQNSSSYSKHSTESCSIWPSTIDRFCGWPTGSKRKTPYDGSKNKRRATAHHHTQDTEDIIWRTLLPQLLYAVYFISTKEYTTDSSEDHRNKT